MRTADTRVHDMGTFNYDTEAELFPMKGRRPNGQSLRYRRFARAADAIRFAVEELPAKSLLGAYLEVDEKRFDGGGIRQLYESPEYPLARRTSGE